jgi:hypothetical protein
VLGGKVVDECAGDQKDALVLVRYELANLASTSAPANIRHSVDRLRRIRSGLLGDAEESCEILISYGLAAIHRILMIARVDIAVLLLVVADMITKPFS